MHAVFGMNYKRSMYVLRIHEENVPVESGLTLVYHTVNMHGIKELIRAFGVRAVVIDPELSDDYKARLKELLKKM